jgi:hypothetical protein
MLELVTGLSGWGGRPMGAKEEKRRSVIMRDQKGTGKSLAEIVRDMRSKQQMKAEAWGLEMFAEEQKVEESAKLLIELIGGEFKVLDLGKQGNPQDGYVRRLVINGDYGEVRIDIGCPGRAEIYQWRNDGVGGPFEKKHADVLPLCFQKERRGRILFSIARMIALSNPM